MPAKHSWPKMPLREYGKTLDEPAVGLHVCLEVEIGTVHAIKLMPSRSYGFEMLYVANWLFVRGPETSNHLSFSHRFNFFNM